MPVARQSYVDLELLWLETKAAEIKTYVDARPLDKLEDRVAWKEVRGGGRMPVVVATIEQQVKSLREMLLDYVKIIDAISKAREGEEQKKKAVRGGQSLSPLEQGLI